MFIQLNCVTLEILGIIYFTSENILYPWSRDIEVQLLLN